MSPRLDVYETSPACWENSQETLGLSHELAMPCVIIINMVLSFFCFRGYRTEELMMHAYQYGYIYQYILS